MKKKSLTYFGILRSITSWSKVSRELIYALLQHGIDISIYERKGFLYDPSFPLDYTIKQKITNTFNSDIAFTFEHPQTYRYLPRTGFNIGLLVYEFTTLPSSWVDYINTYLDLVVVPSHFCKNVFQKSGVDQKKIRVLRYGFNPTHYYESLHGNTEPFTFLCIAHPHKREGIELLLESFCSAFTHKDPVKLVVKLTYIPRKNIKRFEYPDILSLFEKYTRGKKAPLIQCITQSLSEQDMGKLYRSSHAYVSLSRAEAFGLCFLEALASDLPVSGIMYGGVTDFLNNTNTIIIKHRTVKTKDEHYAPMKNPGLIGSPDIPDAISQFKYIYTHYQDALQKTQSFKQHLPYYHWETIAQDFLSLII